MATVNRSWLRRQIEAGKMEGKVTLSLTDDYAFDNSINFGRTAWLPVNFVSCGSDFRPDHCNVWEMDFTSKHGRAWHNDDGTITLHYAGDYTAFRPIQETTTT